MHEFSKFSVDFTPAWGVIAQIGKQIRVSLKETDKALIDKIEIISSELLENAIKYGIRNDQNPQVNFEFKIEQNLIIISVKNGITSPNTLVDFIKIMKEIESSNIPLELYTNKLKELMNFPDSLNSRIGLYRIASQKGIRLFSYVLLEKTLEVKVEINRD